MSDPLGAFLKDLLAETNADDVTIAEDNASTEMPLPNLLLMRLSRSSEISLSWSSLQHSSSSLDSMMSSGSSRWDSMPTIRGDSYKEKRQRNPSIPRRSLEKALDLGDIQGPAET